MAGAVSEGVGRAEALAAEARAVVGSVEVSAGVVPGVAVAPAGLEAEGLGVSVGVARAVRTLALAPAAVSVGVGQGAEALAAATWGGGGLGGGGLGGMFMSPAQQLEQLRADMDVTDDAEWDALQRYIQKVIDARAVVDADAVRGGLGMMGMGGGGGFGGAGGPGGGRGGMAGGNTMSPELQAVQRAVTGNASAEDLRAVLDKLAAVRKQHRAALEKAQHDLREIVTIRQEGILTLNGYL